MVKVELEGSMDYIKFKKKYYLYHFTIENN